MVVLIVLADCEVNTVPAGMFSKWQLLLKFIAVPIH